MPDSCRINVTFSKTYSGNYRHGEPYDFVTIAAGGRGETFPETGISIAVILKNMNGSPLVAVPAQETILYSPDLCICPGGNIADDPTDSNGRISGGGCAQSLSLFSDGILVGTVPVKINSTDTRLASPCFTDASDLAALATKLGRPDLWDICSDFNESGPPAIDSSDLAFFADLVGAVCR